jgi:hypothetical protein
VDKDDHVEMSLGDLCQLVETMLNARTGSPVGVQRLGPFTTVDDRCKTLWPLANRKNRKRITEVCLGKYHKQVGRYPLKMNGYAHGTYIVELEHIGILDDSIIIVRNEDDERKAMPLFYHRRRR